MGNLKLELIEYSWQLYESGVEEDDDGGGGGDGVGGSESTPSHR